MCYACRSKCVFYALPQDEIIATKRGYYVAFTYRAVPPPPPPPLVILAVFSRENLPMDGVDR